MKKRALAMFLALVMAVGMLPTSAWASDTVAVSDQGTERKENTGGTPTQTQSQTVAGGTDGPATMATNTIEWNVSEDSIWGADPDAPEPATLYTGEEYYFNIWWPDTLTVKEVELFVKEPGQSKYSLDYSDDYAELLNEDHGNFYGCFLNKVGTLSYYWKVTYGTGAVTTLQTTTVVVNKGYNYVVNSYGRSLDDENVWRYEDYSSKQRSFYFGLPAEGSFKQLKSNHKKVTISTNGKVTIAKGFVGEAIIQASLPETENYRANTVTGYVWVDPKTPTITKVSSPKKGQLKVSWKKDTSCDGYTVRYSLKKDFSKSKCVTIKKNSQTSLLVKGLKKGKKYYVEMQTYKKTSGETLGSDSSKTKSIKVK